MAETTTRRGNKHVLTVISMMVLVGVEVFGVALSGGWAIAGLFELGDTIGYVLMGIFGVGAAWLMLQLWQKAAVIDTHC